VRLHCSYYGDWLLRRSPIEILSLDSPRNLRLSDRDYYLFNRSSVLMGDWFPVGAEPLFTISFRGFTQAWVFRGDRLAR